VPTIRTPTIRTQRPRLPRRPRSHPTPFAIRMRLALARRRRLVVAVLVALSVGTTLQVLRPATPRTTRVLVAARDLPTGHRLTTGDLAPRDMPTQAAPGGLLARPVGRVLAAPVRRGEPVTDVRVAPTGRPGSSGTPAGWVAVTVRLTDPAGSFLVAPGDRVEVLAGAAADPLSEAGVAGTPAPARIVVDEATVLATPAEVSGTQDVGTGGTSGAGRPAASGDGLLGAFGGERSGSNTGPENTGPDKPTATLPDGVLILAVSPHAALDLAAVNGVRALTVARRLSTTPR
jgi:pilus assembly protein CpaB